jgi:hypothetical protein
MTVALLIGLFQIGYLRSLEIYSTLRYNHGAMRRPTIVMEIALAFGAIGAAALGGLGAGRLGFIVPPIDELFKSLWGTTFVAIIAAILIAKTRVQLDIGRLVSRSRREVGATLREMARNEALRVGTDPDLVETVLLTENLERPRWFRQLERLKGTIFPRGSYGVMQVTADQPLSDSDSIVRAVENHLRNVTLQFNNNGYIDSNSLQSTLTEYNSDPVFISLAMQIFWHVWKPSEVPNVPDAPNPNPPASAGSKLDPDTAERIQLAGQTARLCITATAALSTASTEELSGLRDYLTSFMGKQAERPSGIVPNIPVAIIVPVEGLGQRQSTASETPGSPEATLDK